MDLLHGQIHADRTLLGDWEAQPLPGGNGVNEWEYRVDLEPDGLPQRYTGTITVPAGTDPVIIAARVLEQAASYL